MKGLNTTSRYIFYIEDAYIIAGFAFGFAILRYFLSKFVYQPIADYHKLSYEKRERFIENAYVLE